MKVGFLQSLPHRALQQRLVGIFEAYSGRNPPRGTRSWVNLLTRSRQDPRRRMTAVRTRWFTSPSGHRHSLVTLKSRG